MIELSIFALAVFIVVIFMVIFGYLLPLVFYGGCALLLFIGFRKPEIRGRVWGLVILIFVGWGCVGIYQNHQLNERAALYSAGLIARGMGPLPKEISIITNHLAGKCSYTCAALLYDKRVNRLYVKGKANPVKPAGNQAFPALAEFRVLSGDECFKSYPDGDIEADEHWDRKNLCILRMPAKTLPDGIRVYVNGAVPNRPEVEFRGDLVHMTIKQNGSEKFLARQEYIKAKILSFPPWFEVPSTVKGYIFYPRQPRKQTKEYGEKFEIADFVSKVLKIPARK